MNPSHAKLEEPMSEKEPECKPVYLDHHSTTPCAPEVVKAMQPCFTETYGNPSAVNHDRGRKASRRDDRGDDEPLRWKDQHEGETE